MPRYESPFGPFGSKGQAPKTDVRVAEPMRVLFGEPLGIDAGTEIEVTVLRGVDMKHARSVRLDNVHLEEQRRATRIGTPGQSLEVGDVCLLEPSAAVVINPKDERAMAMERANAAQRFLTDYLYNATIETRDENTADIIPALAPLGEVLEAHFRIAKKPAHKEQQ